MFKLIGLLALFALLPGCAVTRLDANVHTVGAWPAGRAPGTFAYQRLPSQQPQAQEQERHEAHALPAVLQAGFKPAPAESADVLVQVATRTIDASVYWADPFIVGPAAGFYGTGWAVGRWGYGAGWGVGLANTVPYNVHEVAVLIVDARTQQTLYESRARSNGTWSDKEGWSALFSAALRDFPFNAVSPRRVRVDLPQQPDTPPPGPT
jgi:hypothetical protein